MVPLRIAGWKARQRRQLGTEGDAPAPDDDRTVLAEVLDLAAQLLVDPLGRRRCRGLIPEHGPAEQQADEPSHQTYP